MEDKSKCTKEVWDKAQDFELHAWMRAGRNGDDWNQWWAQRFDNYSVLTPFVDKVQSMIEVGCGPYAKNSQILFGLLRPKEVVVADPLLSKYQENGFEVSSWIS